MVLNAGDWNAGKKFFQLGIRLTLTGLASPPYRIRRSASPEEDTMSYWPPPPSFISATISSEVLAYFAQIEASQDLGARTWITTRRVVIPLALPGIVAGSIFTFSLTLGDYITPQLVGGTSATFMGNIIYSNIGTANNLPFAAAMAMIPIVIMAIYLTCARALGALEAV